MNAVDTNILLYDLDDLTPVKQAKARALLLTLIADPASTILLWQVAGELVSQLRRWHRQGRITKVAVNDFIQGYVELFSRFVMPTPAVLDRALDLSDRYSLSHWDSMLLAACLEAGVDTLFTEDMGSPARYDSLQLANPFV